MKDLGLIVLMLLLIITTAYIMHQEKIIKVNRHQVVSLKKSNVEYKEKLELSNDKLAASVQQAQMIIDETAQQRDSLQKELAGSQRRVDALTRTIELIHKQRTEVEYAQEDGYAEGEGKGSILRGIQWADSDDKAEPADTLQRKSRQTILNVENF